MGMGAGKKKLFSIRIDSLFRRILTKMFSWSANITFINIDKYLYFNTQE